MTAAVNGGETRTKMLTVEIEPGRVLVCDPDGAIEHGAHVVVTNWKGERFEGRISTPYPDRVKVFNVRLRSGMQLKRMGRKTIARVVQVLKTNQLGAAASP